MSLLLNMLSSLVTTFLPRSKHLLISCVYYLKQSLCECFGKVAITKLYTILPIVSMLSRVITGNCLLQGSTNSDINKDSVLADWWVKPNIASQVPCLSLHVVFLKHHWLYLIPPSLLPWPGENRNKESICWLEKVVRVSLIFFIWMSQLSTVNYCK